ncbi:glycosyltransferase family 4 protein [Reinekea blandensis]|uniref:Glycosyl transferase, group 1 family protein n=1 Tax=Reinekea blandensis MED297 TaxID=314283 RepID=A4BIW3_9GAMM|nr:glycosyltransferase family 4 protein [Reinekea blandensis]EAR07896.1 glycosyl transferase, group 1 family protein [Reinekea sp. MED297] [Reinekea blandensis MED297]
MKVGFFVYNFFGYSGASTQAQKIAKSVNCDVIVFNHCNGSYSCSVVDGLTIVTLPKSKFLKIFYILYHCIRNRVSILHLHGFFVHGLLLAKFMKFRVVLKTTLLGGDDFDSLKKRYPEWLFRFLIGAVNRNVVLSSELMNINAKHIDPKAIVAIANCVKNTIEIDLNSKENLFCYVGLICERKRTKESIRYFLKNYADIPGAKFVLCGPLKNDGTISELDDNYITECIDLAKSSSYADSIEFLGMVSSDQVEEIFTKAKALLFFSDKEGMPNVVLEAMSRNCVPITRSMYGVMQEIWGEQSKFILNTLDESISIEEVDLAINKKICVERVKQAFSLEVVSSNYDQLYESIANES